MSVKGSWPRPSQVTREEKELREEYLWTDMSLDEFNRRMKVLKEKGLVTRSGRVMKNER